MCSRQGIVKRVFSIKDARSDKRYSLHGRLGFMVQFDSGWNGSPVMSRTAISASRTLMPFW